MDYNEEARRFSQSMDERKNLGVLNGGANAYNQMAKRNSLAPAQYVNQPLFNPTSYLQSANNGALNGTLQSDNPYQKNGVHPIISVFNEASRRANNINNQAYAGLTQMANLFNRQAPNISWDDYASAQDRGNYIDSYHDSMRFLTALKNHQNALAQDRFNVSNALKEYNSNRENLYNQQKLLNDEAHANMNANLAARNQDFQMRQQALSYAQNQQKMQNDRVKNYNDFTLSLGENYDDLTEEQKEQIRQRFILNGDIPQINLKEKNFMGSNVYDVVYQNAQNYQQNYPQYQEQNLSQNYQQFDKNATANYDSPRVNITQGADLNATPNPRVNITPASEENLTHPNPRVNITQSAQSPRVNITPASEENLTHPNPRVNITQSADSNATQNQDQAGVSGIYQRGKYLFTKDANGNELIQDPKTGQWHIYN